MKTVGVLIVMVMISSMAWGKGEADTGFERLKSNIENSKANLDDYQKNQSVVAANLAEVVKARKAAEDEKNGVSKTLKDTKGTLGRMDSQQKEINDLISKEKNQIASEEAKMHELEALIQKIKDNKVKREANIANYQQQMSGVDGDRKNWQTRADQLKEQENGAQARVKQLQAMESQFSKKKKDNEAQIIHWTHEVERQKKALQSFQNLADSK